MRRNVEAGRKLAQALTAATFHGDGKQMTALLKEAASKPAVALAALQVAALIASSTVKQAASLTGQDADLLLQAVFAWSKLIRLQIVGSGTDNAPKDPRGVVECQKCHSVGSSGIKGGSKPWARLNR